MPDSETPTVPPEEVTPVSKVACPVYVGMLVRYLPLGSSQVDPIAGMVVLILDGKGSTRVDLQTFPSDRNGSIRRQSVRHIDDPYYKENPKGLVTYGAWDYILATDSAIGTSALWKQALSDAVERTKVELRAEFAESRGGQGRKQIGRKR